MEFSTPTEYLSPEGDDAAAQRCGWLDGASSAVQANALIERRTRRRVRRRVRRRSPPGRERRANRRRIRFIGCRAASSASFLRAMSLRTASMSVLSLLLPSALATTPTASFDHTVEGESTMCRLHSSLADGFPTRNFALRGKEKQPPSVPSQQTVCSRLSSLTGIRQLLCCRPSPACLHPPTATSCCRDERR